MNSNVLKNRRTKRTTVTLEADVADFIEKKLSQNKGLKEKQLINKLLRSGIKIETDQPAVNFKIEGFKSKLLPGLSLDAIEHMLDEV
jgi:hypothetical protein